MFPEDFWRKKHCRRNERMNDSAQPGNKIFCSSDASTIFLVLLSVISLLAFTGNCLIILAFIKNINLKISHNYLIVNMAVSDLICGLFNWPLYMTEGMLKPGGNLITEPFLASLFCKLGIYVRAMSYVVSILSLVLIAVDRYIATAFPLRASRITGKMRTILLTSCWCLPAAFLVPCLIHSEIVQIDEHTFCRNMMGPNKLEIYSFLGFVVFYCVPLVLIIVLYSRIVKYLQRRKEKPGGEIRGEGSNRLRIRQNQNILKIFGSIVLGFFACWTPLYIYMFLKSLYPSVVEKDTCLLLKLVGILYYIFPMLSTAINPFILITFSSSFRTAVKSECFRFLSWKNHSRHFARVRVVSPQEPSILLLEFTNLSKKITWKLIKALRLS